MEGQVNIPTWQAKFERSFPSEIIKVVNDVQKSETPQHNIRTEGLNPWLVAGVIVIVGITVYIVWKQKQESKKTVSI